MLLFATHFEFLRIIMICRQCHKTAPDGAYCVFCGAKQEVSQNPKKRGNGTGSVYKLENGKYKAVVILGYYMDENGKKRKTTRSKVYDKKKDAIAGLVELKRTPRERKENPTFKELYDRWLPTHRAGKSTLDCYKSAAKYYKPLYGIRLSDIDIDDLQECLDDCDKGKRTKQNMKVLAGLMYKYAIPRRMSHNSLNLGQYLIVSGEDTLHRESFSSQEIEVIRNSINTVDYADYIYCMIYLGFRPSEFLSLRVEDYHAGGRYFVGGSKTEAGTDRTVTVSPKIQFIIDALMEGKETGTVFCRKDGKEFTLREFTDCFHKALEDMGIDNPMVGSEYKRHKYTPHSCRHTFATLMKKVDADSKDKLELIGHTSDEMLRYYQDVNIEDLRAITDRI